ncbi:MAG: hypothetical protein FWC73_00935 [Defluviitaleaceae bacterium]|nr:hypothetical protein [Defluviitaleaceae bacterium]
MHKKAWIIAKINFRTLGALKFATFTTMLSLFISNLVNFLVWSDNIGTGSDISPINALWLLPVMVGIAIPAFSFRRTINLGGKRSNFLWGAVLTYVIIAAIVSLLIVLSNFTIEPFLERHSYFDPGFLGGIANLVEVFGWAERGFAIAFFQQFAFLVLFSAFVHTLVAAKSKWYGWVVSVIIIAIISVFTPIAPLRAALVWFFRMILFHQNAGLQILACLVLATGLFWLSKLIFARRAI